MKIFPKTASIIPSLTVRQMKIVDNRMINHYQITLKQMMENAGRSLAILTNHMIFDNNISGKEILFLIGSGGNGGGALVCARHLYNRDANITICLTKKEQNLSQVTSHQLKIIHKLNAPVYSSLKDINFGKYDAIVDGLLGYNIKGAPNDNVATTIQFANKSKTPIVSLDIPSGLEPDSGIPYQPTIKAKLTLTLALPKRGLMERSALPYIGDLYLADIGVPPSLYNQEPFHFHLNNIFSQGYIIKI